MGRAAKGRPLAYSIRRTGLACWAIPSACPLRTLLASGALPGAVIDQKMGPQAWTGPGGASYSIRVAMRGSVLRCALRWTGDRHLAGLADHPAGRPILGRFRPRLATPSACEVRPAERSLGKAPRTTDRQHGTWVLVLVHTLFVSGVGLSTTFVSVYLWHHGGGLGIVVRYHIALFVALVPGGVIAGLVAGRTDRVDALRLGVALHAAFFLAVLLLGPRAPVFVLPLGAMMGLGMGFYYVAASVLVLELSYGGTASGIVGAMDRARLAAATLTPFAAAFAIDQLSAAPGYRLVFAASFVLFVAAAIAIQGLARGTPGQPLALRETFWRAGPGWRQFLRAQFLRGLRDGVFLFLAAILVFEHLRSEWLLGLFALGSGALGWLVTWWVAPRSETRTARIRLMGVGVILSVASAASLAMAPGIVGTAAFGVLEAGAVPLVAVPFSTESYAIVAQDARGRRFATGYMVAREIPLNLGRLAGVCALWLALVAGWRSGLGIVLVGLALASALSWWVLWSGRTRPVRVSSPDPS